MNAAEMLLGLAQVWLMAGGVVAVAFITIGIDRIDEDARGAYVFRPLLVPGILLLWPMVVLRWWTLETGRENPDARYHPVRKAHGWAAVLLTIFVVGIIALGLNARQERPIGIAPERLSAPQGAAQ